MQEGGKEKEKEGTLQKAVGLAGLCLRRQVLCEGFREESWCRGGESREGAEDRAQALGSVRGQKRVRMETPGGVEQELEENRAAQT